MQMSEGFPHKHSPRGNRGQGGEQSAQGEKVLGTNRVTQGKGSASVFALGIHSPEMPHRRGGTCLSPSTPVLLYNSHEAFTGTASFLPHNSPDLQVLSGQRSRTDSSLPLAIHWMDSKVGPQRSAFLWCVLRVADYHREGHKVVLEPKRP